jgi:hypothetical protein
MKNSIPLMRFALIPALLVTVVMVAHAGDARTGRKKIPSPPPANDLITNAQVETGYHWYGTGVADGATHQKGEAGKAVWFSWTAPASGPAVVHMWDQKKPFGAFNVFTGTNLTKLKTVKPLIKRDKLNLVFSANMGTTYYLSMTKTKGITSDDSIDFTAEMTFVTVALTNPTNGLAIKSSDTVPLSIVTTEEPSMIASVKYYAGGYAPGFGYPAMQIAEADAPPYSAVWTNPIPGNWHIYAELTRTDAYVLDTASPIISIRPYNDDFADRKVLTGTDISFHEDMDNATLEPGEPSVNSNGSAWYTWTAPGDGYVFIPHVYGAFSETINVFMGSSLSTLSKIQTVDHALNDFPFPVTAGETLQIALFSGDLALKYYAIPANDSFASPIQLVGTNTGFTGNNLAATSEPDEPISPYSGGHSVWYTWTAPTNGALILADTNSGILYTDGTVASPLIVTVFAGDALTNLIAVSTNGLGKPAYIPVVGGTTYHIALDNNSTNYGTTFFGVDLSFAPAPPNDGFADRTVLTGDNADLIYTSAGASTEPGEPDHGQNSLWWSWTAPYSGTALVTGAVYSPARGHAYTGDSLANLTLVGSDDQGYFLWNVQAGTTYQIAVSDWAGGLIEAGFHLHYYTNGTPIDP